MCLGYGLASPCLVWKRLCCWGLRAVSHFLRCIRLPKWSCLLWWSTSHCVCWPRTTSLNSKLSRRKQEEKRAGAWVVTCGVLRRRTLLWPWFCTLTLDPQQSGAPPSSLWPHSKAGTDQRFAVFGRTTANCTETCPDLKRLQFCLWQMDIWKMLPDGLLF